MDKQQARTEKKHGGKKTIILPTLKDYLSRREWEKALWQKILNSKKLLKLLITSHEQHTLVMRAAVFEGLLSDKGQRQLSRELSISLQTINAVKKAITENNYRSYSERSKTERKKKKYSNDPIPMRTKHKGRPVRTKYGTLRIPY